MSFLEIGVLPVSYQLLCCKMFGRVAELQLHGLDEDQAICGYVTRTTHLSIRQNGLWLQGKDNLRTKFVMFAGLFSNAFVQSLSSNN